MYNEAVLSFLKNSKWWPGTSFQWETRFSARQLRHPFLCLFTAGTALLLDNKMTQDIRPSCICCQSIYTISHSITVSNAGVMHVITIQTGITHLCPSSYSQFLFPKWYWFQHEVINTVNHLVSFLCNWFDSRGLIADILETQSPLVLSGSGWVIKLNFIKMKLSNYILTKWSCQRMIK